MGEEDLGKMAVALLNCQSRAENRPTFPCTPDMVSSPMAALQWQHIPPSMCDHS